MLLLLPPLLMLLPLTRHLVETEQLQQNRVATACAQLRWMDAVCKFKNAESDVLQAMLEESEAEKDLNQLQWEESVRQLDSVTEAHVKLVGQYRELTEDFRRAVEAS